MSSPRLLSLDALRRLDRGTTVIWATPSVRSQVEGTLGLAAPRPLTALPPEVRTVIAVGGGAFIDDVKLWRLEAAPCLELIAIPSVWGSGAEASPVAVRNRGGKKVIRMDPKLLPDARAILPGLAATLPLARAKLGCGDCWAHALEGFLSPLATDALRSELAALMNDMLKAPIANAPVWFELSAAACAGQARSSVGLVHGIAHTLEGPMRLQNPDAEWGHARICSIFLWPVMCFNQRTSTHWQNLSASHGLNGAQVMEVLRSFFDRSGYQEALPALRAYWMAVLRDPCSRTNSTLVRPASLQFFERGASQ